MFSPSTSKDFSSAQVSLQRALGVESGSCHGSLSRVAESVHQNSAALHDAFYIWEVHSVYATSGRGHILTDGGFKCCLSLSWRSSVNQHSLKTEQ
jgi:hypothetical protein